MGKRAKAHKAKVLKRNNRLKQEKSKLQKLFDNLIKANMNGEATGEDLNVVANDTNLNFEVVEEIKDGGENSGL